MDRYGSSAPRTPSQSSHPLPPRSQQHSNSAKRRRVDRTPRQVLAHEQDRLQQSAQTNGRYRGRDGDRDEVASSSQALLALGEEGYPGGSAAGPGRRRSVGKPNRMATPSGYLRRLADDPGLPPPTPDPEPSLPSRAASSTPAIAAGPSRAAIDAVVSPAKSIFSSPGGRSDDDVLSQLLPSAPVEGSSRASQAFGRHSGGDGDGRHQPLFGSAARDRDRDRNRPLDLNLRSRPRASGGSVLSDVESQVGRNRLSGFSGGRLSAASAFGDDLLDDDLTGDLGLGRPSSVRGSGVFPRADDRVFRSPPSAKGPIPGSAPLGRTLSSLSSPEGDRGAPHDEAELDVDVPEDDPYGFIDHDTVSAALGRRSSSSVPDRRITPLAGDVSRDRISASPEMDMDLGTDDEGSAGSSTGPAAKQQQARAAVGQQSQVTPLALAPLAATDGAARAASELEEGEVEEGDDGVGLGAELDQSALDVSIPVDETTRADTTLLPAVEDEPTVAPFEPQEAAAPRADSPLYEPDVGDDEDVEELADDGEDDETVLFGDLGPTRGVRRARATDGAPESTQKRRKRPQRYTSAGLPVPELPRSLIKDLFSHFAGKQTRTSAETLEAVMDASHDFFAQLMADAAKAADRRSGTARVSEADLVKVMTKAGLIGPKVSVQSLGRKFGLPKELQAVLDGLSIEQEKKGSRRKAK